jgi:hypothetical protein
MRRFVIAGALGLAGAVAFAACKLDLDEGLIDKGDASVGGSGGNAGTASGGTAGGPTGGTGGTVQGDAGPCDADPQCVSDAACIEGRCAGGQCLYELCPTSKACEARSCDTSSNTCTTPSSYGFKATAVELDTDIGCSGNASRCVAAFADLVFVATSDGTLHAWRTTNPATPQELTVQSPTFPIAWMLASETRLLILSSVASGNLQVAWIDAPSDPKATSLSLSSAGVNFPGTVSAAYPSGADGFLLVDNDAQSFYPAAQVTPPVQNTATITQYPSTGLASGASIIASSGSRLLSYRVDTSNTPSVPNLAFVTGAGTSNAQTGNEAQLSFEAPTSLGAHYFWSAYDGSVLWTTNKVYQGDAGGAYSDTLVFRWLVSGATGGVDGSLEVDIASYSEASWNTSRRGPCAMIDPGTALVTAAYPADTSQTLVRSVLKSGSSLSLGSATAVLPFSTGSIGIAANRKVGFILTPSSTTPLLKTTLHVFAPACG